MILEKKGTSSVFLSEWKQHAENKARRLSEDTRLAPC